MMKNDSLKEIGQVLKAANSVAIFPHVLLDGDAIGSAKALCQVLRDMGKSSFVVTEDKIPDYLDFLAKDYTIDIEDISQKDMSGEPDICLCIDCGTLDRFPLRADYFNKGKTKVCIDHHKSNKGICDYNYIDPGAAATGEIIFDLLLAMEVKITSSIADALFAAITTDTGNFQYSNTTKRTHEIVTKLYDYGLDSFKVSVALYENEAPKKIKLHSLALSEAKVFAGGKGIIASISQDMLKKAGALMEDSEGIVSTLRSIKDVQIAVLVKEQETGEIKVSMRAKEEGDVAEICSKYNGGGHVKAAGCTLKDMSCEEATKLMMDAVSETFGK